MPSRNIVKVYLPDTFYHVYNRGASKNPVFLDDQDYQVFLSLLKRYLSSEKSKDMNGQFYDNFHEEIELLAYCLMPNHLHLLIYQHDENAMKQLLQRLFTAYGMYFNKRYKRSGRLFEGHYRARNVDEERYLWHISRYIHLNPLDIGQAWEGYPHSSYEYFVSKRADWVRPERLLEMFSEHKQSYPEFMNDYVAHKEILDELKFELANA